MRFQRYTSAKQEPAAGLNGQVPYNHHRSIPEDDLERLLLIEQVFVRASLASERHYPRYCHAESFEPSEKCPQNASI